jgi:UPF0716 protein FxsA
MRQVKPLVRSFDKDFFTLVLVLILYAVVPFAEIFLFVWLGYAISIWLVLAIAAVVGLPGVLVSLNETRRILPRLRERIRDGRSPGREIAELAGILAGSLFLITPGFITDVLGYLLLVPSFRAALTRVIARSMKGSYRDLQRYLEVNGIGS